MQENFWQRLRARLRYILQHDIISPDDSPLIKSLSVAVGVWAGITPLWGAQLWLALGMAWLLRLNKLIAMLASNVSIPPFIPLILWISYELGSSTLGSQSVGDIALLHPFYRWLSHTITHFQISDTQLADTILHNLVAYLVGSLELAAIAAAMAGIATYLFLGAINRGKE